jgi:hypothetical protein
VQCPLRTQGGHVRTQRRTASRGTTTPFRLNWAQAELLSSLHECNLILKARQLGFTTFIQLFMLDACLFNSNIRAGTIAHRLDDARTIFRDKVKFPYDNLPDMLKAARPIVRDSADELVFGNNSSIRVSTSMRSGTLQYLHISEYGQVCARYPDKAREIRTGALNAVQAGESTAEGNIAVSSPTPMSHEVSTGTPSTAGNSPMRPWSSAAASSSP